MCNAYRYSTPNVTFFKVNRSSNNEYITAKYYIRVYIYIIYIGSTGIYDIIIMYIWIGTRFLYNSVDSPRFFTRIIYAVTYICRHERKAVRQSRLRILHARCMHNMYYTDVVIIAIAYE